MRPPFPPPLRVRILPFTVEEGRETPGWRRLTLAVDKDGGARERCAYAPAVFPDELMRQDADTARARWRSWTAWNLLRTGLGEAVDAALAGVRAVVFVLPHGTAARCPFRGTLTEWAAGIEEEHTARLLEGWLAAGADPGENGPSPRRL